MLRAQLCVVAKSAFLALETPADIVARESLFHRYIVMFFEA